jgi:hypothetical protein
METAALEPFQTYTAWPDRRSFSLSRPARPGLGVSIVAYSPALERQGAGAHGSGENNVYFSFCGQQQL